MLTYFFLNPFLELVSYCFMFNNIAEKYAIGNIKENIRISFILRSI